MNMRRYMLILLAIKALNSNNSSAQPSTINLSLNLGKEYTVVRFHDSVFTLLDDAKDLLQYNLRNKVIQSKFSSKGLNTKMLFELYFKDKSKMYEQTLKAYAVNNMKMERSKIVSYTFDRFNDAFALIRTNYAVPQSDKPDNIDYSIEYFFIVAHIKADTVHKYYILKNTIVEGGYEVIDFGTFVKSEQGFIFTLFNINSNSKYFLCEYVIKGNVLEYSGRLLKTTFPKFHQELGLGYDMLDFVHRNGKIALHTSNSIIDLETAQEMILQVKNIEYAKFIKPTIYGQTFDVPYITSDFFISNNSIKLIYTLNKEVFINTYEYKSSRLLTSNKLDKYKYDDLQCAPIFDSNGNILIQLKGKLSFVYIID